MVMMTTVCNFLKVTKLCDGLVNLEDGICDASVSSARPLFCTEKCSQPIAPYDCSNIKLVNKTSEELNGGFITTKPNLKPGTAVLHQWKPLDFPTANWSAGIISITGPDLILWQPKRAEGQGGGALHLPKLSLISEFINERVDADTPTPTTTTPTSLVDESSLELLYILDLDNSLKIDAWYGGRYQGYAAFDVEKNSVRAWEPVFQNLSDSPYHVFFATTKTYELGDLNLKNIFSS